MKPINRTKQRKQYLFMGFGAYLLIQFVACHYCVVATDNLAESLIAALDHATSHPLDMFPVDWNVLMRTGLFGLLVPLLFHAEYLKKRDLRPSVESGSAKWNEDLKKYYKKYCEITHWPKLFDNALLKPIKVTLTKINDALSKIPVIKIFWNFIVEKTGDLFIRPDDTPRGKNMIFSKEVYMSMDIRKTYRNNNVMIFGGSGTGKSRFFAKPNIYQANCSFVITDPSGELLESTGSYLQREGYEVRVFNLAMMEHSNCYNPFKYIRDDQGVLTMINALIKNTTPKGSSSNDPFWEKAETALLQALCFFLVSECNEEDRNFSNVMKLLRCAEVKEGQEDYDSTLDILFKDLKEKNPEHIAVRQYAVFKQAAGKTAQSILVSCSVRLAVFNMEVINKLTGTDDIDLSTIGDKKTALFCITPTADTTFNFLVSLLYTQLFETLYHRAETECKGKRLPVHVRFILDEFANIAGIPEFEQKLATMRKFEISCAIIYQAMSQAKTQYKDEWETLIGNCDSFLFLGGSDATTLEYISKKLGKETIRSVNNSRSYGKQGSYSISHNKTARELMTPDELSIMDNNNCILFIRGENPFFCTKYPLEKHPAYKYTGDANDKYLFDVKELINTGEKKKVPVPKRRPVDLIKDMDRSDGRESEREMRRNSRPRPKKSIKGQDIGVTKPLNEGIEEYVKVSTQAQNFTMYSEQLERDVAENNAVLTEELLKQENQRIEETFGNMFESEGGSDIPHPSEMMFNTYGDFDMEEPWNENF